MPSGGTRPWQIPTRRSRLIAHDWRRTSAVNKLAACKTLATTFTTKLPPHALRPRVVEPAQRRATRVDAAAHVDGEVVSRPSRAVDHRQAHEALQSVAEGHAPEVADDRAVSQNRGAGLRPRVPIFNKDGHEAPRPWLRAASKTRAFPLNSFDKSHVKLKPTSWTPSRLSMSWP